MSTAEHAVDRDIVDFPQQMKQKRKRKPDRHQAALGNLRSNEPHLTDSGNAQRLIERFGHHLRYVPAWRKWLVWDGKRWSVDDGVLAVGLAQRTILEIYRETPEMDQSVRGEMLDHLRRSEQAERLRAMVFLARSIRGVAIATSGLNQHPWLLNVLNGTIDLRTGQLGPHDPSHLLTQISPVEYLADATCPQWEAMLDRILAGNADLLSFVRRLCGYWLTGSTCEQNLPVFHGEGSNGKSTMLTAIMETMGEDYAMKAGPDLLMVKRGAHPTERADLFAKRFVACIETEQESRLAESLTKELTGSDRIRARRMKEDFWEFAPTHKIVLACNHKPEVRGTDEGIWRRLRIVPFSVRIPDAEKDLSLPNKLKGEYPGILRWCVAGCLEWQRDGLGMPADVTNATKEYRAEEDVFGSFEAEMCVISPASFVSPKALLDAFQEWSGQKDFNSKQLAGLLKRRGYTPERLSKGRRWRGIGLRSDGWDDSEIEP